MLGCGGQEGLRITRFISVLSKYYNLLNVTQNPGRNLFPQWGLNRYYLPSPPRKESTHFRE